MSEEGVATFMGVISVGASDIDGGDMSGGG